MREPGNWMQNPTDDRILEVLDTGLMLGPTTIGKNIGKHRVTVSDRLRVLREHGFVENPEEGYYLITGRGRAYLAGEFDASDLDEE